MIDFEKLGDEQKRKLAARGIARAAGRARTNPRDFFSFVIREETTRERVQCLPHQRLGFRFVEHFNRCVIRWPVGFSKTYTMAALSMFLLGRNNTTRGAVISASQTQAQKPVAMVRDYIETSQELRLVFPHLRPSTREGDHWTQSKLTVARPAGIRDPSLTAVGLHGKLPGARLNWILVDDILTEENTSTEQQRNAVTQWLLSSVMSRRDVQGAKIVVTNTPWHPEDLTYKLEAIGWPTMTMDIDGNVFFSNTGPHDLAEYNGQAVEMPYEGEFDSDEIRPSHQAFPSDDDGNPLPVANTRKFAYRLTAHDDPQYDPEQQHLAPEQRTEPFFDKADQVPLWPQRYGTAEIAKLKEEYQMAMHQYNQLYRCICRDDDSARVKVEWIDRCKEKARERGIHTFTSKWDPADGPTFTGIDLGIAKKRSSNRTSIFTFAVLPDKHRRILRIDSGKWYGNEVINRLQEHYDNYSSIIRLESNAAQDLLRQWALERNVSLPIRPMPTGKNKKSKLHGVESIFLEIENGAWLIPNDHMGRVHEAMQRAIDACLYYDPDNHTEDELMAWWMAREQARESGALRGGARDVPGQSVAALLGAR